VLDLEKLEFTMAENKLICVIGATGNQGGSVARRFGKAGFRVRGLTRDTSSPAAQKLAIDGIEITKVDLADLESLKHALKGANVIFSVTDYWEPFFRPDCRQNASGLGTCSICLRCRISTRQEYGRRRSHGL
jgi:putative NADH-flavin reductase